jgi:hypothetical protein
VLRKKKWEAETGYIYTRLHQPQGHRNMILRFEGFGISWTLTNVGFGMIQERPRPGKDMA